jgi:hypothetical protein
LSYETAADALLALAVSRDGPLHNGDRDDPIRRLLYLGAEACQRVDQAQADREAALLYAAELRCLLERAVRILEAQPLPAEGGTWDGYVLAHQARELLRAAPQAARRALREERHVTRCEGAPAGPPSGGAVTGGGAPDQPTRTTLVPTRQPRARDC